MPILAGFHVEGNDHLILHALVAKVLSIPEAHIRWTLSMLRVAVGSSS